MSAPYRVSAKDQALVEAIDQRIEQRFASCPRLHAQIDRYRHAAIAALEFAHLQLEISLSCLRDNRGDQASAMALTEAFALLQASVSEARDCFDAAAIAALCEGEA